MDRHVRRALFSRGDFSSSTLERQLAEAGPVRRCDEPLIRSIFRCGRSRIPGRGRSSCYPQGFLQRGVPSETDIVGRLLDIAVGTDSRPVEVAAAAQIAQNLRAGESDFMSRWQREIVYGTGAASGIRSDEVAQSGIADEVQYAFVVAQVGGAGQENVFPVRLRRRMSGSMSFSSGISGCVGQGTSEVPCRKDQRTSGQSGAIRS